MLIRPIPFYHISMVCYNPLLARLFLFHGEQYRIMFYMNSDKCKCGNPRAKSGRYCLECKAAYNREWRKSNPLSAEQKRRDNCRSYTNIYIRRGKLIPEPCEVCQADKVEAHHDDYDKPLSVRWLCRPCHLAHHGKSA